MKLTHRRVQHEYGKIKGFIGASYNHAKKWASGLDEGLMIARNVYKILQPILNQATGGVQDRAIGKALDTYADIKQRAIHADNTTQKAISDIRQVAPGLI